MFHFWNQQVLKGRLSGTHFQTGCDTGKQLQNGPCLAQMTDIGRVLGDFEWSSLLRPHGWLKTVFWTPVQSNVILVRVNTIFGHSTRPDEAAWCSNHYILAPSERYECQESSDTPHGWVELGNRREIQVLVGSGHGEMSGLSWGFAPLCNSWLSWVGGCRLKF